MTPGDMLVAQNMQSGKPLQAYPGHASSKHDQMVHGPTASSAVVALMAVNAAAVEEMSSPSSSLHPRQSFRSQ